MGRIKIKSEDELRDFLRLKGFAVNHAKHDNENGHDIVAIKDGYSFLVEFKKIEKRECGTYRFNGSVKGQILFLSLSCGSWTFWNGEGVSITKTCRLLEMMSFNLDNDT